jgi:phosphatidylglycerophosphate synthase
MSARALHLVIDARPRGARGPLAAELVLGKSMLDHLLELADELVPQAEPVVVHARDDELGPLSELAARFQSRRVEFVYGPPRADAAVLRTDRFYDSGRLKRGLRRGRSPESAVIWRLDRAETLARADEELIRRRSYQPLGKYWAFPLAQRLAERLAPTVIRPNALTLTSAGLMLFSALTIAAGFAGWGAGLAIAISLATALVLDTADGRLARLQGTSSAFGRWLDQVLDELADLALHAAIAWAAFNSSGRPGWLLLGIAYASSKYLFQVQSLLGEELERELKRDVGSNTARLPEAPLTPALSPQAGRGGITGRAAVIVRLIGHADVRWHLWIGLALFGRLDVALVSYAFYFALRAIAGAVRKAVRYA